MYLRYEHPCYELDDICLSTQCNKQQAVAVN